MTPGEPVRFWIPIFENQSDQSVEAQDRIDFLALQGSDLEFICPQIRGIGIDEVELVLWQPIFFTRMIHWQDKAER